MDYHQFHHHYYQSYSFVDGKMVEVDLSRFHHGCQKL
jgi:hypothetical protein